MGLAVWAVIMMVKLMWRMIILAAWLYWAMIALTVAMIASVAGNKRLARQWTRSLNWGRLLRL